MAHFAEIDNNGLVIRVLVVGDDQEHRGQEFLADDLKLGGTWVQTSYNNRIRARFAVPGYTYDETNDLFLKPQPFPSWTLDTNFEWQAPLPKPSHYQNSSYWDEEKQTWVQPEPNSEVNDLPT